MSFFDVLSVRNPFYFLVVLLVFSFGQSSYAQATIVNLVYTSDAHYGITRKTFRGDSNVTGHIVNAAMIRQINTLPNLTLPEDGGVSAGRKIAAIDYLVETGDITNRMEVPNQSAASSWKQFETDYMHGLDLKGHDGRKTRLLLAPGNHDISNAIGYYKPMRPLTDPTAMVKIYNLMLNPKTPLTNETYDYSKDKINYSKNIHGVHLMFITLWPDSAERIWMQKDLDTVAKTTPVIIFTHDPPTSEAAHFTNPALVRIMSPENKFENLNTEVYKEGTTAVGENLSTDIEQRGWVKFLKSNPNIKAYFHGHSNWNEFYDYTGPDHDVDLKVFRVDSPMKGKFSAKDETLMSFQLITLDPLTQTLSVRECLWNTSPKNKPQKVVFGKSTTLSIKTSL